MKKRLLSTLIALAVLITAIVAISSEPSISQAYGEWGLDTTSAPSITINHSLGGNVGEIDTVNGSILTIDMADVEQSIDLSTTLKPRGSQFNVIYTVEPQGENGGDAIIDSTGSLTPTKMGKIKVIATAADGLGRVSDSIIINIISSLPTDIVVESSDSMVLTSAGFYATSTTFRQFKALQLSVYDDLNNQYTFEELDLSWYWETDDDTSRDWNDINNNQSIWQSSCPYIIINDDGQLEYSSNLDNDISIIYIKLTINNTWNGEPISKIVRIDQV